MTYSRKIGSNKGKARVWLEGACLADAGWTRGDRFSVVMQSGRIVYRRDSAGARRVAGADDRPIIDTNTDAILDALGVSVGDIVSVSVSATRVLITAQ